MAVIRCLHDKNYYDDEWKVSVLKDFTRFSLMFFGGHFGKGSFYYEFNNFIDENGNIEVAYNNLEEHFVMWLKLNYGFDWEDDDKHLETDESCEGTYEDEIYSLLGTLFDEHAIIHSVNEITNRIEVLYGAKISNE